MIQSTDQLLFQYRHLKDPHHKIQALVKSGKLIPLKRELYETDPNVPGFVLANTILGPSYLSFEWALAYHGLIPERVEVYTSATFGIKKRKEFQNVFGIFSYQDIPKVVFPYYYNRVESDNRVALIASKEKALCDQLCKLSPIRGLQDFNNYLFEGLRLDEEAFAGLDRAKMRKIAPLYHKTNLKQLLRLLDSEEAR